MPAAAQTQPQTATGTPTPERLLLRLEWKVIRRLDGLLQGDYRTMFYGAGMDLADLREYQPLDDVRQIDWNVTARMDAPHVRQHLEERELTAWMLLDRSPSMSFGPEGRPKGLVLAEVVATLSRLLTRRGNRVGAIFYTNAVERTIPPLGGRNQVLRLAHDLLKPPPATTTATDLSGLIHAGLNSIKRRSLVFVISDFISDTGWERPLLVLARRHDVMAIRLWDPREVDLPDVGVVAMEDSETGEQLFVDTSDPYLRQRVAELARERQERLDASFRSAGVDHFDISTEEDMVMALVRMAEERKGRRH